MMSKAGSRSPALQCVLKVVGLDLTTAPLYLSRRSEESLKGTVFSAAATCCAQLDPLDADHNS